MKPMHLAPVVATAALLMGLTGFSATSASTGEVLRAKPSVPMTVGECRVTTLQAFQGATINGGKIQILELVWGVLDGKFAPACQRYIDANGTEHFDDQRSRCSRIFNAPDEMGGFVLPYASGVEVLVETLTVGVGPNGSIIVLGVKGTDSNGKEIDQDLPLSMQVPACVKDVLVICSPDPSCSGTGCPAGPPCNCAGSGACKRTGIVTCPSNGYCPPPNNATCQLNAAGNDCACL